MAIETEYRPDLSMGWRYQVTYLTSLGLKVVVPDMLGYGQTSAPDAPSEYTLKKMSNHMAALIELEGDTGLPSRHADDPFHPPPPPKAILAAHDWGAQLAWRVAMWHPKLVRAIASFCVPFIPPSSEVLDATALVEKMPNFRYQLYLASGAVEGAVGGTSPDPRKVAAFLHGNFGGTTPENEPVFSAEHGIHVDRMMSVRDSPLASAEMVDHYVQQYMLNTAIAAETANDTGTRNPLTGPCNWYRTHELNSRDEAPFAADCGTVGFQFPMPAMIVMAENDVVLRPELADGQEVFFAAGLKKEVVGGCSHWVLIHRPDEANRLLGEFIGSVLDGKL